MKKLTLLLCISTFLGLSQNASAQYYFYDNNYYDSPLLFEVGGSLNAMNCLTDIGGKKGIGKRFIKDLNIGKTTVSGGLFFSVIYKNAIAIRLEGTYGKVQANDNVLTGVTDIAKERFNRNLNFRSNISEISLLAEFHPLYIFVDWASRDEEPPRLSPYLVGGVGYYSFNPQGNLDGRWVDLQPLHTEGQGFKEYPDREVYKLKQMNIPLGLGVRYELSQFLTLRGEFVYRKLFTDYLDDVSTTYIDPALFYTYFSPEKADLAVTMADRQLIQKTNPFGGGKRGSPKEKDAYFSFNIKLGITLGRERY
ncbi:MAG: hypothetical protein JSR00_06730 [Bacteroidetes bacterium]|nr:hypothetical protein [Bacteroidota bacterium]